MRLIRLLQGCCVFWSRKLWPCLVVDLTVGLFCDGKHPSVFQSLTVNLTLAETLLAKKKIAKKVCMQGARLCWL